MSDFLSNFSGDNYEKTRKEKSLTKESHKKKVENQSRKNPVNNEKLSSETKKKAIPIGPSNNISSDRSEESKRNTVGEPEFTDQPKIAQQSKEEIYSKRKKKVAEKQMQQVDPSKSEPLMQNSEELIETDTTYKKKKRQKLMIIIVLVILSIAGLSYFYYEYTHVKVPNFEGEELSEVRIWSTENGVELKVEQKYNFEKPVNEVFSQNIKSKKIKKGNELKVEASLGPNPDDELPLPDFKTMKLQSAKNWIKENKADNLTIIEEYSDTIPAGDYSKIEMVTKDVKEENYKRKDKAKLYYSKGKETYEKNISMSDFIGKTKEEAVEWAKKNELTLKVDESDSDTVEAGKVISQSIPKETMVAKKESFTINVSKGKAILMPDFSQIAQEEVDTRAPEISVQSKQVYSDTIPYGHFVSQSIEAGQKFVAEKPVVEVTYSAGKPYLKDLRDNTLEGDLQKIFYEEYQSKGANITYRVYYLDSSVTKGTVVKMSNYNEFVPTTFVVQIGISKGNLSSDRNKTSD